MDDGPVAGKETSPRSNDSSGATRSRVEEGEVPSTSVEACVWLVSREGFSCANSDFLALLMADCLRWEESSSTALSLHP